MEKFFDVDKCGAQGVENFKCGFNCAQSVVATFAEYYNLPQDVAMRIAASFGGGMGRLRMTCGALSGLFMLAGLENGSPVPGNMEARTRNYALVQELGAKFKEINGSMICAELLKLRVVNATSAQVESPRPSDRTAEYYKNRPCPKIIESACRIYAEYLKSTK